MNPHLESDKLSLLSDYDLLFGQQHGLDHLWQTFRRTAVEPGQASSPNFASFVDECLFCAQIVPKELGVSIAGENRQSSATLWDPRASAHTRSPQQPSLPFAPPTHTRVGLIYLYAGPANVPAGEANIGVIVNQGMQHRGYAREAVQLVLRWAFEELKFHRVQAAVLDTPFKDKALRLFIGSGFVHEGTKRRAVYQPEGEGVAGVWKDVTYLAMLDTEWMLRSTWCRANQAQERPVVSVWDEMFARHSREREELVRWEEAHGRMRRTSSTETLRERIANAAPDLAYLTDDASSVSGDPSVRGSPPRNTPSPPLPHPNVVFTWDSEMEDALDLDELQQRWGLVDGTHSPPRRSLEGSRRLLVPSPRQLRSLPSIPSRLSSENDDPHSPLTIPSPSARSTSSSSASPPASPSATPYQWPPPSPSPAPSSTPSHSHTAWTDSEDEDNWLSARVSILSTPHAPSTSTHPLAGPSGVTWGRPRSDSASSASTDAWSDAQSSWDDLSDMSDHEAHRGGV